MVKITSHAAAQIGQLTPRFGQPGSRIAGSKYVRWYCVFCGEPMRVSGKPWPPAVRDCERCAGRHGQIAVPSSAPLDDVSGYQANAIRAMEGD
jgi:hypothetical protein